MADEAMTYQSAGVDYDALDAFKRACQREAATTRGSLAAHGAVEAPGTRGESAYLIDIGHGLSLAHVEEGLGTKNLVADAMAKLTGKCYYRGIGIDTVATIVNDMITVGCLPMSVAMHAAVGDSGWFRDEQRAVELAAGFAEGCRQAGAVWGGGETPALRDIVDPRTIVLAGSAVGLMRQEKRIRGDVEPGDAIIFLASSGVHTNGLTLCRALADRLPQGYLTPLADGRTFGEALLAPSLIYARFVLGLAEAGIRPHYLVHVTGHGWRKLMRLDAPLRYVIEQPHPRDGPPALFGFIVQQGPLELREAYGTFNMGVGFAAIVGADVADAAVAKAREAGHEAWMAGTVEEGQRSVEVPSLNLRFSSEELRVR